MLTFYYLSGSPFSWRVWLALEHKRIPFKLVVLKRDAGDLQTQKYLALNPHGKAPTLVDEKFTLYEANAISEYIEDKFCSGSPLWPDDVQLKARGRQIVSEIDSYIYPHTRKLVEQLLIGSPKSADLDIIELAHNKLKIEVDCLAKSINGLFFLGRDPSSADYALYPLTAILGRLQTRFPQHFPEDILNESVKVWQRNVEELSYFDKTIPPHWKHEK